MRLRVQVIDKKYSQVYLVAHHHGSYLGITAHRSRIHTHNIGSYSFALESLLDQFPGRTGTNQVMVR